MNLSPIEGDKIYLEPPLETSPSIWRKFTIKEPAQKATKPGDDHSD